MSAEYVPEPLPQAILYVLEVIEKKEVVARTRYADCPWCGSTYANVSEGLFTCDTEGCGKMFLIVDSRSPSER